MAVYSTPPEPPRGGPEPDAALGSSSAKASPRYSIEPITTEAGLSNLEEDWNRLSASAASPNVFMTYDWFRAWNQRLTREDRSGRRRPHVLVLKREGAVAGLAPFIHRTASRFGFVARKLEFVGRQADYNDFVLGDDPAPQSAAIVDFLAQTQEQWDLVDLRDLRETGGSAALIESALSRAGLKYRLLPEGDRCPYLLIDAPWSEMLSRHSRASRGTFRKQQSRLARMRAQGLRVRMIENPQEESGLLEKLLALEHQKHVHGKLSQPFMAVYPEVFQSLFDTLGPRGWCCIALMELGARPLAWQLCFRCGRSLWAFLTAYDHSFARLSPGTMLFPEIIEYGFSRGYNEYDLLRGEESYKGRWATSFHQTCRLLIWSRCWTSRARAFIYLDLKTKVYRLLGRTS